MNTLFMTVFQVLSSCPKQNYVEPEQAEPNACIPKPLVLSPWFQVPGNHAYLHRRVSRGVDRTKPQSALVPWSYIHGHLGVIQQ